MRVASHPLAALASTTRRSFLRAIGEDVTAAAILLLCLLASTAPAVAQAPSQRALSPDAFAQRKVDPNQKMLVTADQLEYDARRETVSAVGNVQIYYDGAVLEARRVELDRRANTLRAIGNVRLTDRDGKVVTAENLALTQDFRQGFIDSLRLDTPDRTHFAAARADRTEGNITVFQNGVYTACEPCRNDPTRPVLWQIKAKRIIHNQEEQMIYFENATLEFFGAPIAYFPFLSAPDPTVKRKTGFLIPEIFSSSQIGTAVGVPFFWNIAPDRDLTLTPTVTTKQGLLMQGEWRQRLIDGSYTIRAAGIVQQDKDAFITSNTSEYLPGYRDNRGAIESTGNFAINQYWSFGWDGTLVSDRTFLRDYDLIGDQVTTKTSFVNLTGQKDRGYFDLRGLYFLGMSVTDDQDRIPIIGTLNYSKTFDKPLWEGESGIKVNLTSLSRDQADLIGTSAATSAVGAVGIPTGSCTLSNPNPQECLLRGAPGDYTRLTAELYWKKTVTDSWGQMWTPFVSARADVASVNVKSYGYDYAPTYPGQNPLLPGSDDLVRAMPAIGLDYRYPFISLESWGTQTIEPRAQIIVRPNETDIGSFPNEDAQSLVFDDTNLFQINKYSGYDRVEGGSRANVGVTYTAAINGFGTVNSLVGQSYSLFGRNSFAYGDMANTGLESGLETGASDYITRLGYSPTKNLEFISRFRFQEDNLSLQRLELQGRTSIDKLGMSVTYGRYAPQPLLGYYELREGVYTTAAYKLSNYWTLSGGVRYNIAQSDFDYTLVGLSYIDECFTFAASYITDYTVNGPGSSSVNKVLVRIGLRTLGESGFSTTVGSSSTSESTSQQ